MSSKPFTVLITKKITDIKYDYSHITSRLFSSQSKSKQKSNHNQTFKSMRQSIEKVEQMGEVKFKQAMKHVNKFNEYQKKIQLKKQTEHLKIDSQCTFKPKINKSSKYNTQKSKFMNYSMTNLMKAKTQQNNADSIRQKNSTKNKIPSKITNHTNKNNNQNAPQQRLINWGKNKKIQLLSKTIQNEFSRNSSKESLYSLKSSLNSSQLQTTFKKPHLKKLDLALSHQLTQSQQKYHRKTLATFTPKTDRISYNHLTGRASSSFIYQNTGLTTPKGNTQRINLSTEQNGLIPITFKKREKIYTQQDPEEGEENVNLQGLLVKQAQRGEGTYYLRQARANVLKKYQKSDLLIKDRKYTKTFSNLLNKV